MAEVPVPQPVDTPKVAPPADAMANLDRGMERTRLIHTASPEDITECFSGYMDRQDAREEELTAAVARGEKPKDLGAYEREFDQFQAVRRIFGTWKGYDAQTRGDSFPASINALVAKIDEGKLFQNDPTGQDRARDAQSWMQTHFRKEMGAFLDAKAQAAATPESASSVSRTDVIGASELAEMRARETAIRERRLAEEATTKATQIQEARQKLEVISEEDRAAREIADRILANAVSPSQSQADSLEQKAISKRVQEIGQPKTPSEQEEYSRLNVRFSELGRKTGSFQTTDADEYERVMRAVGLPEDKIAAKMDTARKHKAQYPNGLMAINFMRNEDGTLNTEPMSALMYGKR